MNQVKYKYKVGQKVWAIAKNQSGSHWEIETDIPGGDEIMQMKILMRAPTEWRSVTIVYLLKAIGDVEEPYLSLTRKLAQAACDARNAKGG